MHVFLFKLQLWRMYCLTILLNAWKIFFIVVAFMSINKTLKLNTIIPSARGLRARTRVK